MILSKTHALTPTHTVLDMGELGGLCMRHARNAVRAHMALTGFLSKSARSGNTDHSYVWLVSFYLLTHLHLIKAHKAGNHLVQKRNPSDNSDPPLVSEYTLFALQPTPAGLF